MPEGVTPPAGGAHGAQDAAPGASPDPARQAGAALTEERFEALLSEKLGPLVNRVVASHLKRFKPPAPVTTPTPPEGDDQDEGEGEPDLHHVLPEKAKVVPAANSRERARLKALETELAALKQERDAGKAERLENQRDQALRRAIESADPVSVDDAFYVLRADRALKVSDDGTYFVEGKDGEIPLDEWAKKQIESRSHFRKPTTKGGNGAAPRGGPGSQKLDRSRPGEERLSRLMK